MSYGTQPGVQVLADTIAFANWARVRRIWLVEVMTIVNRGEGTNKDFAVSEEDEEKDTIFGRYIRTNTPLWGKSWVFVPVVDL